MRIVTPVFIGLDHKMSYRDIESGEVFDLVTLQQFEKYSIQNKYCDLYYKYYLLHREDGPASIQYDANNLTKIVLVHYYLDGINYTVRDWFKLISKENRIKYLFDMHKYP